MGLKGANDRSMEVLVSKKLIKAGVSDPKFEDDGCWAKSPELHFLG